MARYRQALYVACLCLIMGAVLAGYYLWHRYYIQPFSCRAFFVQHHPDETLSLWLNYNINGNIGMLSINGHLQSDPEKKLNRKISFRVERKDNVYYLTSQRNMKFPDDNVENSWLEKYEPLFFIYPEKSIYIRINKQQNGKHLFVLGALPTYMCHSSKKQ